MNTINFNDINSYSDLNLFLLNKTIGAPKPKIDTLEIPGSSVPIDFTEFFGDVQYETRKLKFDVGTFGSLEEVFSNVQNKLNGQKMKIRLSDDAEYYYIGRITVSDWSLDKIMGKFTIEAECEPYKYKNDVTIQSEHLCGKNLWSLSRQKELMGSNMIEEIKDGRNCLKKTKGTHEKIFDPNPNIQYTITAEVFNAFWICIGFKYEDGTISYTKVGSLDKWETITATSIKGKKISTVYWSMHRAVTSDTPPSFINIDTVQVEVGDTKTEYEPYKMISPKTVILNNNRQKVVPKVITSQPITLKFDGVTATIDRGGTYTIPELVLSEGEKGITIEGTKEGTVVKFEYQEGSL